MCITQAACGRSLIAERFYHGTTPSIPNLPPLSKGQGRLGPPEPPDRTRRAASRRRSVWHDGTGSAPGRVDAFKALRSTVHRSNSAWSRRASTHEMHRSARIEAHSERVLVLGVPFSGVSFCGVRLFGEALGVPFAACRPRPRPRPRPRSRAVPFSVSVPSRPRPRPRSRVVPFAAKRTCNKAVGEPVFGRLVELLRDVKGDAKDTQRLVVEQHGCANPPPHA